MGGSGAGSAGGLRADAVPPTLGSPLLRMLLRSGSRLASCGRRCSSSCCGLPRSRVAALTALAAAVAAVMFLAASRPLASPHATGSKAATGAALVVRHSLGGAVSSRSRYSGSADALRQPQQRPCHEACPLLRRCHAGAGVSGVGGADLHQIVNASLGPFGGRMRRANDSVHRRNYRFLCAPKHPCSLSVSLTFPPSSTSLPPVLQTSGATGRTQLPLGGRRSVWWAVFVVTSAVGNVEQRAAIRDTWARSAARHGMRVVFLVGLTLDSRVLAALGDEWARHGDLIIGDFPDSYDLLTVKSVAMLRWAQLECGGRARYLVKIDDDIFVSVPHLLAVLRANADKRRAIIGARRDRLHVELRPNHKWRDPLFVKHYGSLRYPTYMSGTTYVIAMPLVGELFAASQAEPFDRMEDVFVTGLCARRAGNVTHVGHGGFTASHRRACSYASPLAVTGHHVSPHEMRWLWSKLVANAACKPNFLRGESRERNNSLRPATLPPIL